MQHPVHGQPPILSVTDGWATLATDPDVAVFAPISGTVAEVSPGALSIVADLERVDLAGVDHALTDGAAASEGEAIGVTAGALGLRVWRASRPHRRAPWGPLEVVDPVDELARAAVPE